MNIDLIERMLDLNFSNRISAQEILEHPWMITEDPYGFRFGFIFFLSFFFLSFFLLFWIYFYIMETLTYKELYTNIVWRQLEQK